MLIGMPVGGRGDAYKNPDRGANRKGTGYL